MPPTSCRPNSRRSRRSSPGAGPRREPARLRLGVNIDHVATIRNARGAGYPDPVRAALLAAEAAPTASPRTCARTAATSPTTISRGCPAELTVPLNLEMAATDEMLAIALRHRPHAACIVPEKREERTTEGGLDAAGQHNQLAPMVARLRDAGIRVSLFIEPDARQIEAALRLGAPVVEFHTGGYAHSTGEARGRGAAPPRRRGRARRQERDRAACRPRPDLSTMSRRSPRSRSCASSTSAIS